MNSAAFIRRLSSLFRQGQRPERSTSPEPGGVRSEDSLPPGSIPIEMHVAGQQVPGTTRYVGELARVFQTPTGELVTFEQTQGMRLGCGHIVYAVQERFLETGIQLGIGGFCQQCAAEAEADLQRGVLTAQQAQEKPWYCSQCAKYCDGCGRRNICSRHAESFTHADGRREFLCPDCRAKAKQRRFFQGIVKVVACVLGEEDHSIQEGQYRD